MMNESKTSPALIAAAWLLVSIPLTWGIYNTARNAARLFTEPPAAAHTAPAAHPQPQQPQQLESQRELLSLSRLATFSPREDLV